MPQSMERAEYNRRYGPTTGDRVRLADTNLYARIEHDDALYGAEPLFGFGRPLRDGSLRPPAWAEPARPGRHQRRGDGPGAGHLKTNIGIKDGRIVGIGRAGNPDVTDNIDLILSSATGIIDANGPSSRRAVLTRTCTSPAPACWARRSTAA